MPDTLNQWAARWRIPEAALVDLRTQLAPPVPMVYDPVPPVSGCAVVVSA